MLLAITVTFISIDLLFISVILMLRAITLTFISINLTFISVILTLRSIVLRLRNVILMFINTSGRLRSTSEPLQTRIGRVIPLVVWGKIGVEVEKIIL